MDIRSAATKVNDSSGFSFLGVDDNELVKIDPNDLVKTTSVYSQMIDDNTALNKAIGEKASITDLSSHTGNGTIHVTSTDKTNWNAAKSHADSAHAPSNAQQNVQSDWNATSGDAFIKNKPSIPTESTVSEWGFTKNTGTYSKPSDGIPKSDLASSVQTSLGKADTALQLHQDISGKLNKSGGVMTGDLTISNGSTLNIGESVIGEVAGSLEYDTTNKLLKIASQDIQLSSSNPVNALNGMSIGSGEDKISITPNSLSMVNYNLYKDGIDMGYYKITESGIESDYPIDFDRGIAIKDGNTGKKAYITHNGFSDTRDIKFPDKNGTIALTSDLPTSAEDVGADTKGSASSALEAAKDYSSANLASAKVYTDTKVADLVGTAPETMDTLQEVAAAIEAHQDVTDALNSAIGNKVDKVKGKGLSTYDFKRKYKETIDDMPTSYSLKMDYNPESGVFKTTNMEQNPKISYKDPVTGETEEYTLPINYKKLFSKLNEKIADLAKNGVFKNKTNLDTHISDGVKHITENERTNWDSAKTHADSTHARTDATKVEKSSTNGNIKINGTETTVYTHPSGTNPHGTTKSDVGLGNVGNFKAVSTVANQGLTETEKANARSNIGAGASSFSGSYNDLTNKPTIPSVGNGTVTIKQAGKSKGSFTMNQSGNTTIELTDNNTVYTHPTSDGNKHVPANGTNNGGKYLKATATAGSYEWGSLTKSDVTTALGYTPPTTNTTYGVATSSALGLVKSGTDITVDSSGNVSVNDDSHNHVISNVDGLQTALDGKAPSNHTHDDRYYTEPEIDRNFVSVFNSEEVYCNSAVTVNDLAEKGASVAMVRGLTDNPFGVEEWVHVWSNAWRKGLNSSWVSQIALGVERGEGMLYRTSQSNAVGKSWTRLLDSSNYKTYCTPANIGAATYEEGTWTPIVGYQGSSNYSFTDGRYTKMGNIVHCSCKIYMKADASERIYVSTYNLPFTGNYGIIFMGGRIECPTSNVRWSLNHVPVNAFESSSKVSISSSPYVPTHFVTFTYRIA